MNSLLKSELENWNKEEVDSHVKRHIELGNSELTLLNLELVFNNRVNRMSHLHNLEMSEC